MEKVKSIPNSVCGELDCKSVVVRRCAGAAQFSVSEGEFGEPTESGRVRRGCIAVIRLVWNIPVTAADTRLGDADVSGRSEGGVTVPP